MRAQNAVWRQTAVVVTITATWALARSTLAQPRPPEEQSPPTVEQPSRVQLMEQSLEQMKRNQRLLEQRLKQLEHKNEQQELELLQQQAGAEIASEGEVTRQADETSNLKQQEYRGGQRALQALNPEISIVGDAFGKVIFEEYAGEDDRSGFVFRMVGLHFQSDLDPFSFTKVTVGITPGGVGLGEAYMTWTSVLPGVSLTVGKFRQEFGVVNRWHVPSLDQVDFPLALREVLGPEGLNQIGLSVEWLMPRLWAHANHLMLQVTNGQNDRLFAGKYFSIPAVLLRAKSYYDLTESTYFELGLTGMVGWNNRRGVKDEPTSELEDEAWRETWLWGADWTLMWEPLRRAKYRNVVLRGELYGVRQQQLDDTIQTMGLYQYIQAKVSQSWELGARFDWAMPFAVDNEGRHTFGLQPYVTWWQSPWVRARLLYAWTTSDDLAQDDHRMLLQLTFAAGPHKHERY